MTQRDLPQNLAAQRRDNSLRRTLATLPISNVNIVKRSRAVWHDKAMLTGAELDEIRRDMKEAGDWAREELRKNSI
jgi:hypothetical protein